MEAELSDHGRGPPVRIRLLLISADPVLTEAVHEAARRLSAWLEVMPNLESGIAWLLHPSPTATHALVDTKLPAADIETLAGMVDEVTGGFVRLFLLCHRDDDGSTLGVGVFRIEPCDTATIERVLRAHPPRQEVTQPEISGAELSAALHGGRLSMRFQPVLDAGSLAFLGVEALARLHHPTSGILRPSQFMQRAIETGQERALSTMAAARAVMDLRGQAFMLGRDIAFNVPLPTFMQEDDLTRALEICAIASQPVARVVIELVETTERPDLRALSGAVERWRAAGFRVTIDDAGPRLPHWRDMLDLAFTGLKLDGSLASALASATAEMIIAAAKSHSLHVVAEGIEDTAAAQRMRNFGADALQGYFFCRPLPAHALRIWAGAWDSGKGSTQAVLF